MSAEKQYGNRLKEQTIQEEQAINIKPKNYIEYIKKLYHKSKKQYYYYELILTRVHKE